jgi:hypothetical protein
MLDNRMRRELLTKARQSGFPGSILDVYSAYEQGKDLIAEYEQQQKVQQTQQMSDLAAQQSGMMQQAPSMPEQQLPQMPSFPPSVKANIPQAPESTTQNLVSSEQSQPVGMSTSKQGPRGGQLLLAKGGFKPDPPKKLPFGMLPPMNTLNPVEVKATRFDTSKYPDLGINQPLPTYRPVRKSTLEEEVYWNQVPDFYKKWGKDGIGEDVLEFLDPTGIMSHDDAKRAYESWKESGRKDPTPEEGLEMFGAVPALGKFGKIKYIKNGVKPVTKYIPWQQILNTVGFGKDMSEQVTEDKKAKGGFEKEPAKPDPTKPRGRKSDFEYKIIEGKYVFTLPDGRPYTVDNKDTANKLSKFIKSGKWGWISEEEGDGYAFGRLRSDSEPKAPMVLKKEDLGKPDFTYQIRPTYGNMANLIYNPRVYTSDYNIDTEWGNREGSGLMYTEPYQERSFYRNQEYPDYENISLKPRARDNYAYSVIIDGEEYSVDHPYEGPHKGYGYVNIPNRGEFEIDYRSGKPELKKSPTRLNKGGFEECYTCNRNKLKRYSK